MGGKISKSQENIQITYLSTYIKYMKNLVSKEEYRVKFEEKEKECNKLVEGG